MTYARSEWKASRIGDRRSMRSPCAETYFMARKPICLSRVAYSSWLFTKLLILEIHLDEQRKNFWPEPK